MQSTFPLLELTRLLQQAVSMRTQYHSWLPHPFFVARIIERARTTSLIVMVSGAVRRDLRCDGDVLIFTQFAINKNQRLTGEPLSKAVNVPWQRTVWFQAFMDPITFSGAALFLLFSIAWKGFRESVSWQLVTF
jgi:hypothetical protein